MHDFLRTEWKTIVIVTVFCAVIYAWFYAQEREKKADKDKPYEYTCFRPGVALAQYKLGSNISDIDLANFTPASIPNDVLGIESYASSREDIFLNFRLNHLSSIEFYPSRYDDADNTCSRDIAEFTKTHSPISQDIPVADRNNIIYAGAVYISRNIESDSTKQDITSDRSNKNAKQGESDSQSPQFESDSGKINADSINNEPDSPSSASDAKSQPDSWLIVYAQ